MEHGGGCELIANYCPFDLVLFLPRVMYVTTYTAGKGDNKLHKSINK